MASVARISIAPVKGLGLLHPQETLLTVRGAEGDRRFHLVDAQGLMFNGKRRGDLVRVRPRYDAGSGRLELAFPDGTTVAGEVELGEPVETIFFGRPVSGRFVSGPWSEALSAFTGEPLRLVRPDEEGDAIDRVLRVSLVSDGSLAQLAARAGGETVDGRRFRMTFELTGCAAHEEDEWIGRRVRVGDAVVVPREPVGRCAVTTHDPETGVRDLDTLRLIAGYRGLRGESIDFGVCGTIEEPGRVRVGDPVEVLAL